MSAAAAGATVAEAPTGFRLEGRPAIDDVFGDASDYRRTIDRFLDDVVLRADTDPVKHMRLAAVQRSRPLAGAELIAYWRPEREIDPIEANALHGGRMSLLGSIIVAAETVWSSGVGASVGLEAGYTQLASGIASRVGMAFRLRRAVRTPRRFPSRQQRLPLPQASRPSPR